MHKIISLAISLILFPIVNLDNFIYHIVTTPAEDSRYGVTINYHCAFPKSCIEYTTANDKEFKEAKTVSPQVELWSTRGIEKTSTTSTFYTKERYVCHVTLTSLKPNTQYIYRIIANAQISEVKSFKTASGKEKWNFVAFTDFQHYNNAVTHPLIQKMKEKFNPPLAICSGDMVDVAGFEQSWNWLLDNKVFSDIIFAASPGDHEFWADAINGKYPQYTEPHTYNHLFRFPQNGAKSSLNSSYYFYYNNVLFISLDMNNSNISKGERFNDQVEWFQKTLDHLRGTYEYIVVYEHKSIFGSSIIDSAVGKYIRPQWYPVFQKYNVDLVLSGHDHIYSRTYQLDGNQKSAKKKRGTYYLDMGSSGDKRRDLDRSLTDEDTLHAKVIDLKGEKLSFAANIEVTKKEMKVSVYNQYMQLVDSFTIKAKR